MGNVTTGTVVAKTVAGEDGEPVKGKRRVAGKPALRRRNEGKMHTESKKHQEVPRPLGMKMLRGTHKVQRQCRHCSQCNPCSICIHFSRCSSRSSSGSSS